MGKRESTGLVQTVGGMIASNGKRDITWVALTAGGRAYGMALLRLIVSAGNRAQASGGRFALSKPDDKVKEPL
jgi:hypothetical protein